MNKLIGFVGYARKAFFGATSAALLAWLAESADELQAIAKVGIAAVVNGAGVYWLRNNPTK